MRSQIAMGCSAGAPPGECCSGTLPQLAAGTAAPLEPANRVAQKLEQGKDGSSYLCPSPIFGSVHGEARALLRYSLRPAFSKSRTAFALRIDSPASALFRAIKKFKN